MGIPLETGYNSTEESNDGHRRSNMGITNSIPNTKLKQSKSNFRVK